MVKPASVDVGFEVMDGVEGLVVKDGEGAGGEGADEKGAEQTRGMGDSDGVDVRPVWSIICGLGGGVGCFNRG